MSSDQRFFDFLKERIGLDVTSVGPAIIERAVRQRSDAVASGARPTSTGSCCKARGMSSRR